MAARLEDREPEEAVISREGGKFTVTFERPPMLLFVSTNGDGTFDQLFIDGKESTNHYAITIESAVKKLTTYRLSKYACMLRGEEDA